MKVAKKLKQAVCKHEWKYNGEKVGFRDDYIYKIFYCPKCGKVRDERTWRKFGEKW